MLQTVAAAAIVIGAGAWLVVRALRRHAKVGAAGCANCGDGGPGGPCGSCPVAPRAPRR